MRYQQKNNGGVRIALLCLGVVFLAAPLSVVLTICLSPVWSWFEAATGIESFGHAGPAEWCYLVAFLVLALSGLLWLFIWLRGARKRA